MIDATTGRHVGAERYDQELANIFAPQKRIAQEVILSPLFEYLKEDF